MGQQIVVVTAVAVLLVVVLVSVMVVVAFAAPMVSLTSQWLPHYFVTHCRRMNRPPLQLELLVMVDGAAPNTVSCICNISSPEVSPNHYNAHTQFGKYDASFRCIQQIHIPPSLSVVTHRHTSERNTLTIQFQWKEGEVAESEVKSEAEALMGEGEAVRQQL